MKTSHLNRLRLMAVAAFLVFVTLAVMLPGPVQAGFGPKIVMGYVLNNIGEPLSGASVTVNIRNPDNSIQKTLTDDTDNDGFYMVTFDGSEWDEGDTIEVIATYDGDQEDESVLADDQATQQIDIHFPWPIPQFGSAVGFLVAGGAVGAVGVAAIAYKKRKTAT